MSNIQIASLTTLPHLKFNMTLNKQQRKLNNAKMSSEKICFYYLLKVKLLKVFIFSTSKESVKFMTLFNFNKLFHLQDYQKTKQNYGFLVTSEAEILMQR